MVINKIAFVIDGLQMGGAEKFLIYIANNFYRNGFNPLVILLSEETALIDELNKNIRVEIIKRKSRYDLFISKRIKRLINSEGINKIFCINTYAFFLTKLAFLFDRKVQFYLSLHTTIPSSIKSYLQNLIYTRFICDSDFVIYICNNQKQYLQKKYYLNPKLKTIIYNGIDTSYFNSFHFSEQEIASLRMSMNLADDDKVIIKVARLFAEKGHFDAIDALKILHEKNEQKPYLLFVGGGEKVYVDALKRYAKEKKLENYILFTGNQWDVRKYYCLADVFTLTSFSVETFSLAALEAMAFGLPCSLTDIGGAGEMIVEGVTGYLSQVKSPSSIAESWEKLLNKNIKGQGIRNFVLQRFSSERMLRSYLELVG